MAQDISKRYTTTGAQDSVDVNASHSVTVGVTSENGDVTISSVDVQLGSEGRWYPDTQDITEGVPYTLLGTIQAIRINVSSMGTSSYYDFDITTSNR